MTTRLAHPPVPAWPLATVLVSPETPILLIPARLRGNMRLHPSRVWVLAWR